MSTAIDNYRALRRKEAEQRHDLDDEQFKRRATIATAATMATSMLQGEHWLEAMQYQCRAVAAGLGLTCPAVLEDARQAIRLTCEYVSRQAMVPAFGTDADVLRERSRFASPRECRELVSLWQAIADAHFEPSADELEQEGLCRLAMHWSWQLRNHPTDRAHRENARRTIVALEEAVKRLEAAEEEAKRP